VVDPFSGSATTGVACLELDRQYLGIELRETFGEWSRARLQDARKAG
jgi:site-specific DNA-methyltransferase (adenine-specific)